MNINFPKPAYIFARDQEWQHLTSFAERPSDQARLGIVSGRRRMGKTFLLRELVKQHGGFYFGATAATEAESLRQFGAAVAKFSGLSAPFAFAHWDEAISYLFDMALPEKRSKPLLVVIDEFPYLVKMSPVLPSLLQREIDAFQNGESRMRLLLCGSAMSVMGGLLGGTAPLRGRAQLEIIMRPFGFQDAATFWNVADQPRLAAKLFSIVGGTPAYLKQFLNNDAPASLTDFDDWVCRTVLSPISPLFREARYLLAEEAEIRDTSLYHSVLAAVAAGNRTRGCIANYIGRKSVDISHPLNVLEDSHLLVRETDIFRAGKSVYRITEPLINFYESVMRPAWPSLEAGQAGEVWAQSAQRFDSQVAGPQFEALCREFVLTSTKGIFAFPLGQVGSGIVTDPAARQQIEIDVAVTEPGSGASSAKVLLLGEAKWGTVMGLPHLTRLLRAKQLLENHGMNTDYTKLVCFSAAGFSDALSREAKQNTDISLIGLSDIYLT